MARRKGQSLGRKDVVAAGLACIVEEGPDALNVNRVAQRLGIRTPSLYNHVTGADDLRRAVVLEVLERASLEVQQPEDESDAMAFIRALAHGMRHFAQSNANLYIFLMAAPLSWDADPYAPHWMRTQERFIDSVRRFNLPAHDQVHAARFLFASILGFIRLELRGSYAAQGYADESFDWMLDTLGLALSMRGTEARKAS